MWISAAPRTSAACLRSRRLGRGNRRDRTWPASSRSRRTAWCCAMYQIQRLREPYDLPTTPSFETARGQGVHTIIVPSCYRDGQAVFMRDECSLGQDIGRLRSRRPSLNLIADERGKLLRRSDARLETELLHGGLRLGCRQACVDLTIEPIHNVRRRSCG